MAKKTENVSPVRVQKYIADCGLMSRRAAEALVEAGEVKIGGRTARLGDKVTPGIDTVTVSGKPALPTTRHTYIMLHKPRGYIATMSDDRGRKTVADLVADLRDRVVPVGRLDRESEGLLLMTNDGELTYRLTHPSHEVEKRYLVTVSGRVDTVTIELLNAPMEIDGETVRAAKVALLDVGPDRTTLSFILTEGRNRQIRKMCDLAGLTVLRLKRVAIGSLRLGGLKAGKYRVLKDEEVEYLKSL